MNGIKAKQKTCKACKCDFIPPKNKQGQRGCDTACEFIIAKREGK